MAKYQITVNGQPREVEADEDKPLLWVLREDFGLTGTKFGCGAGLCGACTVHLDGQPVRSCSLPVSCLSGKKVVTIEGLDEHGKHPLQLAWAELSVPQCGYCQSGQIMSAAALLAKTPRPSDEQINQAMSGNLCRCGSYPRIRQAIHKAAGS
ncbi:MAG: (2Fe-2S)-binding protein [Vulcanimicrobiota bacterium]